MKANNSKEAPLGDPKIATLSFFKPSRLIDELWEHSRQSSLSENNKYTRLLAKLASNSSQAEQNGYKAIKGDAVEQAILPKQG